jgi:hypothetical protein
VLREIRVSDMRVGEAGEKHGRNVEMKFSVGAGLWSDREEDFQLGARMWSFGEEDDEVWE